MELSVDGQPWISVAVQMAAGFEFDRCRGRYGRLPYGDGLEGHSHGAWFEVIENLDVDLSSIGCHASLAFPGFI